MNNGLMLNALICLIIFIGAFSTSIYILKKPKRKLVDVAFALFWFFASLVWLSVSLGLYFYFIGNVYYDLLINKFLVQTFIFIHLAFGIFYASLRLFKNRVVSWILLFIYFSFSLFALYFMHSEGGLVFRDATYFSVEYTINPVTLIVFEVLAGVGLFALFLDIVVNYFKKNKESEIANNYMLASFSILLYGTFGYFDNLGVDATWVMVLFRSFIFLSIILAYFAYSRYEFDTFE